MLLFHTLTLPPCYAYRDIGPKSKYNTPKKQERAAKELLINEFECQKLEKAVHLRNSLMRMPCGISAHGKVGIWKVHLWGTLYMKLCYACDRVVRSAHGYTCYACRNSKEAAKAAENHAAGLTYYGNAYTSDSGSKHTHTYINTRQRRL